MPESLPREKFWVRYSSNHELPLSGAASLLIHACVFVLLLLGSFAAVSLGFGQRHNPLSVSAVTLNGDASESNDTPDMPPQPVEQTTEKNPSSEQVQVPDLTSPNLPPLVLPENNGPARPLVDTAVETAKQLRSLDRKFLEGLTNAYAHSETNQVEPSGSSGSTGLPELRRRRLARWFLFFDTRDGDDYRRKLAALDAYVAYPTGDGTFFVIRNLEEVPARPKVEDPTTFRRFYAKDDRPDSVRSLMRALRIRDEPDHFIAFLPEKFEKELLRKEREHRGLSEEEIAETNFRIEWKGKKILIRVESQRTVAP